MFVPEEDSSARERRLDEVIVRPRSVTGPLTIAQSLVAQPTEAIKLLVQLIESLLGFRLGSSSITLRHGLLHRLGDGGLHLIGSQGDEFRIGWGFGHVSSPLVRIAEGR